jgi:hypothetical protein
LEVEIFGWSQREEGLNTSLCSLWEAFGNDSVLAAVRRRDEASRVLLYTSGREWVVHERYRAVRSRLRPMAMGLRLAHGPAWDALEQLLAELSSSRAGHTTGMRP